MFKDFGKISPQKTVHITFSDPLIVEGSGKEEHRFIVDFIAKRLGAYL
jgi:hypothetical protein